MNQRFFLTVGQKYRHETHPQGLHPDAWVEINAPDIDCACELVFQFFGDKWASLYIADQFSPDLYPRGCSHVLTQAETSTGTQASLVKTAKP